MLAGRNSRVFSEALEAGEWVLDFGTRMISLSGVRFRSFLDLCFSGTSD